MNYNPNWNNPQQQYQQAPRAPQPPRNNTKLIVIICVAAVLLLSGLFYVVALVGKTMGSVAGFTTQKVKGLDSVFQDILTAPFDPDNSFLYTSIIDDINTDSTLTDDVKTKLTGDLNRMRKNARKTRELIKLYEDGFSDTLPDKRKFSSFDKKWAHAYFIESGRSASLEQSLSTLQEQTLNDLPDSTDRSRFENIIDKPSTDWSNDNFNQTSDIVSLNLRDIVMQIDRFEKSILGHYNDYVDTH